MGKFHRFSKPGTYWLAIVGASAILILASCSSWEPITVPRTYVDPDDLSLEVSLYADGVAEVRNLPAVAAGECVILSDWPEEIERTETATWRQDSNYSFTVEGEGWSAQFVYEWERWNPQFAEIRYFGCEEADGSPFLYLTSYKLWNSP